jgi:SAM-dependent methyltransferase
MEPTDLSVRDFYGKVWGEYADPLHHPITAQALSTQARVVAGRIREAKPRRVLDLGCGPAPVVRVDSAPLVVCADLVFEMLLNIKATRAGPVACLDACRLPFRDCAFDFIWCGLLIDHIRDPEGWIRELSRVLAPGSTLGMACWNRSELPPERYPENSRMCYTTAGGEELSVASFPTWETTLGLLQQKYPPMQTESFPIVPDEYLMQIAWVTIGTARTNCRP